LRTKNASSRSSVGVRLEQRPCPCRLTCLLVDDDVAGLDRRAEPAGSPEDGADAGEELFERERLDEVVVGAEREAVQALLDGVHCGQEDDREVAARLQASRELEPVDAREHHVADGEIRRGGEDRARVDVVGEAGDDDPVAPERALERGPHLLLVLDDRDPWRPCAHGPSIAPGS
jgi:hypothetical protein